MTDRRFLAELTRASLAMDRDVARLLADNSLMDFDDPDQMFTGNREADELRQSLALLKARQERKRAVKAAWYQRTKARRESAGYCRLTGDATR